MNLKNLHDMKSTLKPTSLILGVLVFFAAIVTPLLSQANAQVRPSAPVINPPLPSQQQPPIATLTPNQGVVGVKLINKTGAEITYQVIGDTKLRTLNGRSEVILQDLKTPVSLSFYRRDRGFLLVTPVVPTKATSTIELTLTETTDFGIDRNALSIDPNGDVYLN